MAIGEQKNVTREWILFQYTLHPGLQSIKALPQIHRLEGNEDARGRG